ncbi:twin-arginine translocation signal domain-containing protein [Aliivibrio finisterrensis]|uniref:molybdopterin-dependent oxidoreductase n=1 Tax=Aliivibrio finisterrensis TaxID=511998 RepID=UPI00101F2107|nr:molybdopterin-dependent oxidoreductase [Aliivibrio finisterrensis]RYU68172.1 twin-arginine translocation signal domain-containing protein [Aliivibrio finisterrensis]RYU71873.1 twin-arginine translocation signal domain-containing protein [Aliivibrio finisterrensis]RYU75482.1 twin-arginine translocation signal domain-containing protein [Aliivibrio finisterrensis]
MAISRRTFLKTSIATAVVAGGGLMVYPASKFFDDEDVEVIPHASHWGPFNAIVKAGVLLGIQPRKELDAMPTEMLTEGLIGRVYDKTRVKYPMVRASYLADPKGDTKPHLRGKEPFVRVSWETALSLVADAIQTTATDHGNEAIFSSSYGGWSHAGLMRPQVLQGRFFNLIGGQSTTTGDYSGGASQVILPHVIGDMEVYSPQTAWPVIKDNTEIFVLIGCDPWKNNRIEFRVADHQMYPHWKQFAEDGIKFISINPQRTRTDDELDAEWVKIVPNTDTALFLAMAQHVYSNDLHDISYLDRYTVGADKYIDHLMGKTDGVVKSPEWAAKITGISVEDIQKMAITFATSKTQFASGWSLQRADHGEMIHWAIINFAAMLGKIGKPGEGVGFSWHYGNGGMPQSGKALPIGLSQGKNPVSAICPASRISEMLMNPGKSFTRDGIEYIYPDVKMVYNAGNNLLSHQQDTNELINALNQKVDTFVCQDPWWCASSRYADIVLPATSTLERNDLSSGGTYSNDKIYAMRQVIKPYGESLDDFEIFRKLADIFKVEDKFTDGLSFDDILKRAYKASSATLSFDEFWKNGVALLPVPQEANQWVRHGDFYQDPDKNPLHTTSGKIELYCQDIANFDVKNCPPMPTFLEPFEYLGNAKPHEVHVVSPHPYMRLHSQLANTEVRKYESVQGRQYVLINDKDAEKHGIRSGQLVEIFNERGRVIAGAKVSDQIMTGVISLEEGAWLQFDSQGRCNSGSINVLTSSQACSDLSQANSANTCLAYLQRCRDPESSNLAFEPPRIVTAETDIRIDKVNTTLGSEGSEVEAEAQSVGEALFYQRCTMCHSAKDPKQYTKTQWHGITKSMFPRAGLNPLEREEVMAFLEANAKDAQ